MVISDGRDIGYVRFGGTGPRRPGAGRPGAGPGRRRTRPLRAATCGGPKNEVCRPPPGVTASGRARAASQGGHPSGTTGSAGWPRLAAHEQCRRFSYAPLLPLGEDRTDYRLVTDEGVDVVHGPGGRRFLTVEPAALTAPGRTSGRSGASATWATETTRIRGSRPGSE